MKVIGHEVDEVQMLAHPRDVISCVHSGLPHTHCCCQKKRIARVLFRELLFHDPQHGNVIGEVLWRRLEHPVHLCVAIMTCNNWVLPVKIKSIKSPLAAKADDICCKLPCLVFRSGNVREDFAGGRALAVRCRFRGSAVVEVPTSNADQSLNGRVLRLHAQSESLIAAHHARRATRPVATKAVFVIPIWLEVRVAAPCGAQLIL
mmetsp:Transcript_26792/g.42982  ORF Transcript_26792/g.42982 Transcript_26792/m.42982 type:complete len:204 (-) Transcript_26792:490-1101(-)